MPESIRRQLGPSRADTGAGTRAAWLTLRRRHLRHRVDPRGGRPRLEVNSGSDPELRLEHLPPAPEQYQAMCQAVGWRVPRLGECIRALDGSHAVVCARIGDELVGFGRLVGDGALYWCIVDVMVDPRFQRRGIGTSIVEALSGVVASAGAHVVALVAAPDVIAFYERLGYVRSPNSWLARRVT